MNRRLALCVIAPLVCAPSAAAAVKPLPGFHSPTGNITCLFVLPGERVLCSITHAGYAPALQDRCLNPHGEMGAGVDWHGWSLSRTGRATVNCSGGIQYDERTFRPTYVTLPYGRTMRHFGITCWSRVTGVTCRNPRGHGVFVSRATWRAW